ncbi:MAG TPA: nuclear transport factor 2 family protein, partial [Acidimicrobiia bacterium]|nr:nuclear transport factor 2 family protein [Acidimicrobiia bacterium]
MTEDARIDRLLAYEEIRQLVARYAVATDARDLDSLVALFVGDVRVGADAQGRDALREFFDRTLREIGITILSVGT